MTLVLLALFYAAALFHWLRRNEHGRVIYESREPVVGWWCRAVGGVQ